MIVVTGGAGFIGSALVWKLNQAGERDILVVDQKAKGSPKWKNLERLKFSDYLESGDFLDFLTHNKLPKVRAIFHMGACSDTTERDMAYLDQNNTGYSARIAEWAADKPVYLAYASSAAAYGGGEYGYSDSDALTPRMKPLNPYGQSKLNFDIWVLGKGLDKRITGFRFFNVYGPNEYHKGHMRSMVHKGFEQVRSDGVLKLFKSYRPEYADGGQKRDFIYIKDVVDAMMWFFQNPQWKGIFNLGTGRAQSWNDLGQALFKACGVPEKIEYIAMPESIKNQYQYFTEAHLAKLRQTGCPSDFLDLNKGVADYVKHYLATPNPYLSL